MTSNSKMHRGDHEPDGASDTSVDALRDQVAQLQQQLAQQERLASMGMLTAGVSHELKSPLNFIKNFAELCSEMLDELEACIQQDADKLDADNRSEIDELLATLHKNAGLIQNHGMRAKRIVDSLMQMARDNDDDALQPTDFNQLIEEFAKIAYHGAKTPHIGAPVTLRFHADPQLGEVDTLPHSLSRVVVNLVSNAIDALMGMDQRPEKPVVEVSTALEAGFAVLRVRDNGPGISTSVKDQIFKPFFTTKPSGDGHIGLGLALCYDIVVEDHKGHFEVDSDGASFTEFRVRIPLSS